MRLSLRLKISFLVVVTLTLGISYGGVYLLGNIKRAQAAKQIVDSNILFKATSEVIHQIQVERGKTALYLNKNLQESEVHQQRDITDSKVSELLTLQTSSFNIDDKKLSENIKSIRELANNHESVTTVRGRYTELVTSLINKQVNSSKSTLLDGIEMHLLGISTLELAKEYAGRTRANLTPLLAARKPLPMTQSSHLQDLFTHMQTYLQTPTMELSSEGKRKLDTFISSSQWQKVTTSISNTLEESLSGAFSSNSQDFYQDITQAMNELRQIIAAETEAVTHRSETIYSEVRNDMWKTVLILGLAMLISITLSVYLIRGITKPIHAAVVSLNEATDAISLSSGQVTNASHQVSSATVQSASALEEVVASIEELNSIVQQNTARAAEGAKLSGQGRQIAEEGQKEIATLINAMSGISASSRRIEEIINVIDDIAFQTNLLALNAAVEAARAGEQGKGFAVVAEAVRALAQRSSTAAKDINSLIRESASQVDNGARMADASEKALNSIVEAIAKISTLNEEISSASSEQSVGIQQITKAMNELDTSTQSNASVAEEVSASADQMTGQVHSIGQLVHSLQGIVDGAA